MSTSIGAKVVRPQLGYGSFAHITATPLAAGGITVDGLLFDGDLTDEQIGEVWWYATSRDDTDRAKREALAILVADAEAGTNGAGWLTDAFAELGRYVLGLAPPPTV